MSNATDTKPAKGFLFPESPEHCVPDSRRLLTKYKPYSEQSTRTSYEVAGLSEALRDEYSEFTATVVNSDQWHLQNEAMHVIVKVSSLLRSPLKAFLLKNAGASIVISHLSLPYFTAENRDEVAKVIYEGLSGVDLYGVFLLSGANHMPRFLDTYIPKGLNVVQLPLEVSGLLDHITRPAATLLRISPIDEAGAS